MTSAPPLTDPPVKSDANANASDIAAGPAGALSEQAWWSEKQLAAWKLFQSLPMPSRKDEDWRFTNVSEIKIEGAHDATFSLDEEKDAVGRSNGVPEFAAKIIFGNNARISEASSAGDWSRRGVIFEPIDAAIENHPEILKKYFMTRAVPPATNKFTALHASFCCTGTLLYVPKGVEIELPFEAFHWMGNGAAVFPHTLVVLEENASVVMVDSFNSLEKDGSGFCAGALEFFLARGSSLRYIAIQNWGSRVQHFLTSDSELERDANSRALMVMLGSRYARHNVNSHLAGEGAFSEMLGLYA
ncbi:MAG: SufD family Fe-S cluster assembly protein, partial [Verrucomicrobiae bacterium]|nr:SufD family Fe-S cluster assembly protein [Verrucomicrobiae bacterium]